LTSSENRNEDVVRRLTRCDAVKQKNSGRALQASLPGHALRMFFKFGRLRFVKISGRLR